MSVYVELRVFKSFHNHKTQSKTNLFLHGHGVPEVDGQLPDVDEGVLVRGLRVQGVHLRKGPLHEVDHGQRVGRGELTVLYIGNVHLLQREIKTQPRQIKILSASITKSFKKPLSEFWSTANPV